MFKYSKVFNSAPTGPAAGSPGPSVPSTAEHLLVPLCQASFLLQRAKSTSQQIMMMMMMMIFNSKLSVDCLSSVASVETKQNNPPSQSTTFVRADHHAFGV